MSDNVVGSAEFELRATRKKLGEDLRASERDLQASMGRIEADVNRSSNSMGSSISVIAGGIAAAVTAVTAALSAAISMAVKFGLASLKMADDIANTAERIGMSTTALQEWQYVASQTGSSAAEVAKDLEAFALKWEQAQAGLNKQAASSFASLGLGRDDLRQFKDADAALEEVTSRIMALSSEADRAAIAEKMGLGSLVNALADGSDEVDRLRGEAAALGFVMDEELIRKGAEAQGQLENLQHVIGIQLAEAFIGLSDEILNFTNTVANALQGLNGFIEKANALRRMTGGNFGVSDAIGMATNPWGLVKGSWNAVRSIGATPQYIERDSFQNFVNSTGQYAPERPRRTPTGSSTLTDPPSRTRTPRTRRDTSARDAQREAEREARRAERVEQEIFRARQRALGIYDRETATVQERYDIERAQTEMERKAEQEQLDSRLARKDITEAEYTQLKLLNDQAAALEDRVASDVLARDLADERLAKERMLSDLTVELLSLQSGAARTAKERRDIELRLLALAQQDARDELETRLSRTPGLSDTDKKAQRDLLTQIQEAQTAAANRANMGPLEAWRDQSLKSAGEIAEAYENVAARGLDALNDGIVDVIMNTRDLGEVFSNVAKQIIADLVSIGVRQSITEPLAARLFGTGAQKATSIAGGNILQGIGGAQGGGGWLSSLFKFGKGLFGFSSGGYTGDGGKLEPKGVVHGGEYVFSKEAVQRIGAGNLEALHKNLKGFSMGGLVGPALPALALQGAGPVSRGGDAPYFDLRGAVMTQDLLKQMNAIGAQAESRANTWATKNVPDLAQSKAAKRQQHQIGRRKR